MKNQQRGTGDENHFTKMEKVLEIIREITSTFTWEDILENIVKKAVDLIEGADVGAIFIYSKEEDLLVAEYGYGLDWEYLKNVKLRPEESLSGIVFRSKKTTLFNDQEIIDITRKVRDSNINSYKKMFQLKDQRLRSSICAPILWKGECLGALAISSVHSSTKFTEQDVRLIEYVSIHAAVALGNSRMYEQQRIHASKLSRSVELHERMTQMVLDGVGLQRISKELANLLSRPVFIFDTWLNCVEKCLPGTIGKDKENNGIQLREKDVTIIKKYRRPILFEDPETGKDLVGTTISAGKKILGYLVLSVEDRDTIDHEDLTTIERVSMVIALEMLKKQVSYETEKRIKVNLFQDTLMGNITEETLQKLSLFGYDSTQAYVCMVCSFSSTEMEDIDEWYQNGFELIERFCETRGVVTFPQSTHLVILHPIKTVEQQGQPDPFNDIYTLAETFLKSLEKSTGLKMQAGVGRGFHRLQDLPISFQEGEKALILLGKYGYNDRIWTYRSLGPLRLLLQVVNEEELKNFVHEVLGPLVAKGANPILVETLVTWVKNDRQVKKTAKSMFVHVNTVFYRLNKIEEILNIRFRNEEDWLSIQIALRLWEIFYTDNK